MEEVCQSRVSDVRREGDIHYLDINADDPTKSLKNAGSARRIPLHPAVIAECFLDYVASLPKDGPLFPDMAPNKFGRRGGNATKIIGRWVRKKASLILAKRRTTHGVTGSRTSVATLALRRRNTMRCSDD